MAVPIDRLSNDLLSDIFLICLSDEVYEYERAVESSGGVRRSLYKPGRHPVLPLILASVSSNWREVAIKTGPLWAVITYDCNRAGKWGSQAQVLLWLDRSKESALDLQLSWGNKEEGYAHWDWERQAYFSKKPQRDEVEFVIKVLSRYMVRCRRLCLIIPDAVRAPHIVVHAVDALKANPSHALLQFELFVNDPPNLESSIDGTDVFRGLWPNLVDICFDNVSVHIPTQCRCLRRIRLVDTSGGHAYTDELLNVMRENKGLIELIIEGPGLHGIRPGYSNAQRDAARALLPIRLPFLQKLSLDSVPEQWGTSLISSLSAPALHHLQIEAPFRHSGFSLEASKSLALYIGRQYLCKMNYLHWSYDYLITLEDAMQMLTQMPNLEVLKTRMHEGRADYLILALLNDADADGLQGMCPNLNTLETFAHLGAVLQLAERRHASHALASLSSISIDVSGMRDDVVLGPELQAVSKVVDDVRISRDEARGRILRGQMLSLDSSISTMSLHELLTRYSPLEVHAEENVGLAVEV